MTNELATLGFYAAMSFICLRSLPEDAYKERHAGMHFQKDSPMSKSVRTVAPFNPFNRVNPTSGGREAPPELMNDLDE